LVSECSETAVKYLPRIFEVLGGERFLWSPVLNLLRRTSVQLGLLVALVAATYSTALHGAFVFDDFAGVVDNTSIRSWSTALTPPRNTTVAGRPITNLTFAANYALSELSPGPIHATNIAIHLLAGLVLLLLVRATLRLPRFQDRFDPLLAFFIAALWLVHPLQTESVTYVVQRVESLGGLFVLLTMLCSLKAHERQSWLWSIAAVVSALLGVGAKEIAAVAPVLVVLFDRAFLFDSLHTALKTRWKFYIALASIWIPTAAIQATNPRGISAGLHFDGFGSWSYLKIQAGALLRYVKLALWPTDLVFDYGEPGRAIPVPQAFMEWGPRGLVVLALLGLSLWAWRRAPALGFLGTAFFLLLAPSSSIVPIATEVIAEHRMYLPLAAVLTLLVLGVSRLVTTRPFQFGAALAGIVAVVVLADLTSDRNRQYGNAVELWQDTVNKRPDNLRAWSALGESYNAVGDKANALAIFKEAAKRDPLAAVPNIALAVEAEARGDVPAAVAIYERLMTRWAKNPDVLFNYSNCLIKQRRWREATSTLSMLVQLRPSDAEAHSLLGEAMMQTDEFELAKEELETAVHLAPNDARTQYRLGNLLARNDQQRARLALNRALTLDPKLAIAKHRLATLDIAEDLYGDALIRLREVRAMEPNRPQVLSDLAWLLATAPDDKVRNGEESLTLVKKLYGPNPTGNIFALELLAVALAETGQFDLALAKQKEALALTATPSYEMQERLTLYQQRKPYHQTYRTIKK
jgi:tetratricopeptide (TPR) repeat protein